MKKIQTVNGAMKSFSLNAGMNLYIADFEPHETIERTFESTKPVLGFYFHLAASAYWDARAGMIGEENNALSLAGASFLSASS